MDHDKIRIYIRVRTVELLLARKNENMSWLANAIGVSLPRASLIASGKVPASPAVRKRILEAFRGMSTHDGKAKWDDFFEIEEVLEKE